MSVLMTLTVDGDPAKLEEYAAADPERMSAIRDAAKERGLIAHRFYGSDDGRLMVVDEWDSAESFQSFFSEQGEEIGKMMSEAGVTTQPQPQFWRVLETHDKYGWGA